MRAYIINLDRAEDRWAFIEQSFNTTSLELCRVSGVDGTTLACPVEGYAEKSFLRFHGRPTNLRHVGCYLSHLKAMQAFLATEDEHALIAEDDLILQPDFDAAVEKAMRHAKHWNILRLSGLSRGRPAKVASLGGKYGLHVTFGRLKGTGAYIIDRQAARAWSEGLLPMFLPIDHALDREWFFGLRAVSLLPFPASQVDSGFKSSIQVGKSLKLPAARRILTTYPYQAFNETMRWIFRSWSYLRWRWSMQPDSGEKPLEGKLSGADSRSIAVPPA